MAVEVFVTGKQAHLKKKLFVSDLCLFTFIFKETPSRVIMRYEGREVTSRDRIKPRGGVNLLIECEVEGGGREVDVELLVGNKVPRNMDINTCRAESRDGK